MTAKRNLAEHEAAHAVAIDDLRWSVLWVNIGDSANRRRQVKADWGSFEAEVGQLASGNDPDLCERLRPRVLDYITHLVAGHLAENAIDQSVKTISGRITPAILNAGPSGDSDRDRVARYLKLINCNTMPEVAAAERRAAEILERRHAHLKALAQTLVDQEFVEGDALRRALGG